MNKKLLDKKNTIWFILLATSFFIVTIIFYIIIKNTNLFSIILISIGITSIIWLIAIVALKIINTLKKLNLQSKIIANTQQGIIISNKNFVVDYVNNAAEQITGYSANELIGRNPIFLSSKKNKKELYHEQFSILHDILHNGTINHKKDFNGQRKSGEDYIIEAYGTAIKNRRGEITYMVIMFNDVTDTRKVYTKLEEANHKLNILSSLDGLTSLANRRCFDETIMNEWYKCSQNSLPLSLMILDIDFFKKYNDTYGHLEGDKVLKKVSAALKEICSSYKYFVARFGGEEFAIIMSNVRNHQALAFGNKALQEISKLQILHESSDVSKFITLSGGVSTIYPNNNSNVNDLIKQADQALYFAKQSGRNQIQEYNTLFSINNIN